MKFLLCLLAGLLFLCGCSAPEDVAFGENFANITLTVPGGWSYEVIPVSGAEGERLGGIEFRRDSDPDVRMGVYYHLDPCYGCGMTSGHEERTFSSGHTGMLRWDYFDEGTMSAHFTFADTPGQYHFHAWEIPETFWEENRETILGILDTARVGEGAMKESDAYAIAAETCSRAYPHCLRTFDHLTGTWTFEFFVSDRNTVDRETVAVAADGSVLP